MSDSVLTWHKGSVLPLASLWHTLQRAAALNVLRPKDLSGIIAESGQPDGRCIPRRANLLFNDSTAWPVAPAVPVAEFAAWLGEPAALFEWSHLGKIPYGLRFLFHGQFRVCPHCLAAGFHSAIFSLRLLATCPIHRCGLFSRCVCGRRFEPNLTHELFLQMGYCACGRMRLFTRETCRRPTMSALDVQPLVPVADWLERLSSVCVPGWDRRQGFFGRPHQDIWTLDFAHWCAELGLGYPSCLVSPPTSRPGLVVSHHACGIRPERRFRRRKLEPEYGRYWMNDPVTTVYRSFARYLRRHVTRGSTRQILDFVADPDPIAIAETMREDRRAVRGFAELAWSLAMEPDVLLRRWTSRKEPLSEFACGRACALGLAPGSNVDEARATWVAFHAGEALVLSRWVAAQCLAAEAVRTGVARWNIDPWMEEQDWSVRRLRDGMRFVALHGQHPVDWTLRSLDKHGRQLAAQEADRARLAKIQAQCRGACLTWSEANSWSVAEATVPRNLPVTRHRLLGFAGERPQFWLFKFEGAFVARACEIRLETRGQTPREAVVGLRCALRRHRQRYSVEPRVKAPLVYVMPVPEGAYASYKQWIACIAYDNGLGKGAYMLHQAAWSYVGERAARQEAARAASRTF